MSNDYTDFNRYFTSSNGIDVPERVSVSRDEWRALLTAIRQAEAQQTDNAECRSVQKRLAIQQPATGEPTPQDVVDAFEKARAGSDKPVGILRGVRAVMRLPPDLKPAPDPIAPATPNHPGKRAARSDVRLSARLGL